MNTTTTFLLTDVEQSTILWDRDPTEMRLCLARHDELIRTGVEKHEGRLIKDRGEGDSHFAVFDRATNAALAAIEIQQLIGETEWTTIKPIKVRIAIHSGEAELRSGDYYGHAVTKAARLRSIAHGGQIVLSMATRELIYHTLPKSAHLSDIGVHRLKDLLRPEHVFQLNTEGIASHFPPLNSLDLRRNNLPFQLSSFIGRQDDIERLSRLLSENRLVTLIGPGGCGKTRLALQVGAETIDSYLDGVWLVDLAPVEHADAFERAVATALSIEINPAQSLRDSLLDYFRDKWLLLILDNCEHLGRSPARFCDWILENSAGIRILATSRASLGRSGERVETLRPLTLPDKGKSALSQILESESVQLMLERADARSAPFQINDDNAAAVSRLCIALEGIPLAIELAASRLKILSPEQLFARLGKSLDLLKSSDKDADGRHRTLRATIDWSFNLLELEERKVLQSLSIPPAGCSLELAENIVATSTDVGVELIDAIESLADKSLLQVEAGERPRYRMLEAIRQYCAEQTDAAELDNIKEKLYEWSLKLASKAKPQLLEKDQESWQRVLRDEYENLRLCLSWAEENSLDESRLLSLAVEMDRFWLFSAMLDEGRLWLNKAIDLPGGSDAKRAIAFRSAGTFAWMQQDYDNAARYLDESVRLLEALGDRQALAGALSNLGSLNAERQFFEEALRCFLQALSILEICPDQGLKASILQNLGVLEFDRENLDEAEEYFSRAFPILENQSSDRYTFAFLLFNMAKVARKRARQEAAAGFLRRSIGFAKELGNGDVIASHVLLLAMVAHDEQHFELAARLLGCSIQARSFGGLNPNREDEQNSARLMANLREPLNHRNLQEALSIAAGMTLVEIADYCIAGGELLIQARP